MLARRFVASGIGVGSHGGIGREPAAWIPDGSPTLDLGSVDVRRASADDADLTRLLECVPRAASTDRRPVPPAVISPGEAARKGAPKE